MVLCRLYWGREVELGRGFSELQATRPIRKVSGKVEEPPQTIAHGPTTMSGILILPRLPPSDEIEVPVLLRWLSSSRAGSFSSPNRCNASETDSAAHLTNLIGKRARCRPMGTYLSVALTTSSEQATSSTILALFVFSVSFMRSRWLSRTFLSLFQAIR